MIDEPVLVELARRRGARMHVLTEACLGSLNPDPSRVGMASILISPGGAVSLGRQWAPPIEDGPDGTLRPGPHED